MWFDCEEVESGFRPESGARTPVKLRVESGRGAQQTIFYWASPIVRLSGSHKRRWTPAQTTESPTVSSMAHIPSDAPETCPVCETAYESITVHSEGLMVGLDHNEQYRRVCFQPDTVDGEPHIQFYHHTHEQARVD